MSRKANKGNRCDKCRMKDTHCICSHLIAHNNSTPVTVLMHYRELVTTTNTARIAHFMLKNSSVHYRGLIENPLVESQILQSGFTPLYLYPSEESAPLTPELVQSLGGKVQLIVPDGSWRQAKRVARREPFLKNVQHVKLSDASSGIFYLRRKIKEEGVSTIEAIARALGVIESKEIQQSMENVFRIMVEKTLDTRGKKLENYEQSKHGT
ncbi:MAG: tRNA-uridine aminocarboxypropyltransferase [Bdellovibrionota bacterium]